MNASGLIVERVRVTGARIRVLARARGLIEQTSLIEDIEGDAVADASGLRLSPIRGRVGSSAITGDAVMNAQEARLDFRMPEVKSQDLAAVLGLTATDRAGFRDPAEARLGLAGHPDRSPEVPPVRHGGPSRAGLVGLRPPSPERRNADQDGRRADHVRPDDVLDVRRLAHREGRRGPAEIGLDSRQQDDRHRCRSDSWPRTPDAMQHLDGTASATASLHAGIRDPLPRGLEGRMQVNVADGVIREFPLLAAINRALRLAEGSPRDTRFERLSATLAFAGPVPRTPAEAFGPGHVTTDDLLLQARDVRVEAAGRIGFDGSLDLAGLAILSPERSAEAVRSVRELSGLRNDRGNLELPIRISGTMDNPAFSIDLKAAVGRSIKEELRRRFRNLFRPLERLVPSELAPIESSFLGQDRPRVSGASSSSST